MIKKEDVNAEKKYFELLRELQGTIREQLRKKEEYKAGSHNTQVVVLLTEDGSSPSDEDVIKNWELRLELTGIKHYKVIGGKILKYAND